MKETLDFIIIGAQKAGTTSLADYMNRSSQVFVPPEKEIPYFLEEKMQKRGWSWYLDTYFRNADQASLWGTSTPQYMMHPRSFVAIKKKLPDVKIIVTLRDPVARLLSHFDMATRLGVEARPLNQVVEEQLGRIGHYRETGYPDHTGKYVVSGEYGRILGELFRQFEHSQVLIIDFEEIRKDPQKVMHRLCRFMGFSSIDVSAEGLQTIRMQGGSRKKIDVDHNRIISVLAGFSHALGLSKFIPGKVKAGVGRLSSKLDEWNVDPSSKTRIGDLRPELIDQLHEYFRHDATVLESLGIEHPWVMHWENGYSAGPEKPEATFRS